MNKADRESLEYIYSGLNQIGNKSRYLQGILGSLLGVSPSPHTDTGPSSDAYPVLYIGGPKDGHAGPWPVEYTPYDGGRYCIHKFSRRHPGCTLDLYAMVWTQDDADGMDWDEIGSHAWKIAEKHTACIRVAKLTS